MGYDHRMLNDLKHDLKGTPFCLECGREAVDDGRLLVEDIEYEIVWGDASDAPETCERCGREIGNILAEISGIPEWDLRLVEETDEEGESER